MYEFNWEPTSLETKPKCVVCGTVTTYPKVCLTTDGLRAGRAESERIEWTYFACTDCGSLTSSPEPPDNAEAYGDESSAQVLHYLDIGAGIDFMLRAIGEPRDHELLVEIGCGFGFTSEYWRWSPQAEQSSSIGVDESHMAVVGSTELGFRLVHPSQTFELKGKADVVFASEVIEHTKSPQSFIVSMMELLKANARGVVLTTPDADFVDPKSEQTAVLAALSPGFHTCVLSRKGITLLLTNLELSDFRVEKIHDRLLIEISGSVFQEQSGFLNRTSPEYLAFLRHLANHSNSRIAAGAWYRIFKEAVNAGDWAEAKTAQRHLLDQLNFEFHVDWPISRSVLSRFEDSLAKGLERHLIAFPSWFAPFIFYSAGLARAMNRPGEQANLLEIAEVLLRAEVAADPAFTQEAASLLHVLNWRLAECGDFLSKRYREHEPRRSILQRIRRHHLSTLYRRFQERFVPRA